MPPSPPSPWAPWGAGEVAPGARGGCLLAAFPCPAAQQIAFITVVSCCWRGVRGVRGVGEGGWLARAGWSFPVPQRFTLAPLLSSHPCWPPGAGELAHESAPAGRTLGAAKGLTLHGPGPQTALLAPG